MWRLTLLTMLFGMGLVVDSTAAGKEPPNRANDFPNHQAIDQATLGARLLSKKEADKAFFTKLHEKYLVLELAFEPPAGATVKVSRDQFTLRVGDDPRGIPAVSPEEVSKALQRNARSGTKVSAEPHRSVGYDSGDPLDPTRRRPGYYSRSTVDVTWGSDSTGASDAVRKTAETELKKKEVALGRVWQPVSGYLYFAKPDRKAKRLLLEFETDSGKVALDLKH